LGKHLDAGDVNDHHVSISNRHDVHCQWIFIPSKNSSSEGEGYYEIRNPYTGMNLDVSQLEEINHICKSPPNNSDSQLWTPVVGTTRVYFRLANKHLMTNNKSRNIFLDFNTTEMNLYCSSNVNDDHTAWCLKVMNDVDTEKVEFSDITWPIFYESPIKLHGK